MKEFYSFSTESKVYLATYIPALCKNLLNHRKSHTYLGYFCDLNSSEAEFQVLTAKSYSETLSLPLESFLMRLKTHFFYVEPPILDQIFPLQASFQ